MKRSSLEPSGVATNTKDSSCITSASNGAVRLEGDEVRGGDITRRKGVPPVYVTTIAATFADCPEVKPKHIEEEVQRRIGVDPANKPTDFLVARQLKAKMAYMKRK